MSRLKSALILLNNVYYEHQKLTRATFKQRLIEADLAHSPKKITDLLLYIQNTFGIELTFRSQNNTIQVVEDEASQYHFIKSLIFNGKLKNQLLKNENHIISFSSDVDFSYKEIIFELYETIIKTIKIKIDYKSFESIEKNDLILKPLLLKEYLSRWYLIAECDNSDIRVYGLERMSNLRILNQKFTANLKAIELYKSTIGVNYSAKLEEVKLWVENYQLKLFETTPLHHSQQVVHREETFGILTLKVTLNYEFKQLLSSFLSKVIVLEPKSLKIEMKQIFNDMVKNYSK